MCTLLVVSTLVLLQSTTVAAQAAPRGADTLPFLDERLSFEARAADLVLRMTLGEKVNQMKDVAPAIERFYIPAYNWWNEALHGVARAGLVAYWNDTTHTWDVEAGTVRLEVGASSADIRLTHDLRVKRGAP